MASDGRKNAGGFKKRIGRQNPLVTCALAQEVKTVSDEHPFSTDQGLSAAFARLHGNPFQEFHWAYYSSPPATQQAGKGGLGQPCAYGGKGAARTLRAHQQLTWPATPGTGRAPH